jgi:YD repeat-containing protein
MITVIHDVKYIENNEVVYKKEPTRVHRYRWDSNDARVGMGWGLAISEIIITIICLIIVFS